MQGLTRKCWRGLLLFASFGVDDDIKEQVAALMKKQKESDADRAHSSSRESAGSTSGASGKKQNNKHEKLMDNRLSGK